MKTAVGIVALSLIAGAARAAPSFSGTLSLTGVYYDEEQTDASRQLASAGRLLYGDLRLSFTAERLADRVDLRFDGRVRYTEGFNFEDKFTSTTTGDPFQSEYGAQGYLGGREYDLRQAYALVRVTDRSSLQLGRMFITEADSMKVDALRVVQRFGAHWQASLFVGGYPNPYSRSVLTDYTPPCGDDVASGSASLASLQPPDPNNPGKLLPVPAGLQLATVAPNACQTHPQLALAGGLTAAYQYKTIWGSFGAAGSYFGGRGDGGTVQIDPSSAGLIGNLLPANTATDPPRVFVSWQNFLQPTPRLDLFSDVVVDLYGSAGPQPTRIALQATGHFLKDNGLILRVGYTHLSSLAINMYLSQLLYNRAPNGSSLVPGSNTGVVENNLTVLRTGRDEARASLDFRLVKRLTLGLDGRFRYRSLIGGDSNPTVFNTPAYTDNERNVAGDATLSLRDRGTVRGIRAMVSYMFLSDYRALDHVVKASIGRDFFKQRFGIDFEYVLVLVRDAGAGLDDTDCAASTPTASGTTYNPFLLGCFGRRTGATHEAGVAMTIAPSRRLFFLVDYRFQAMLTDNQPRYQPQIPNEIPTVLSHSLLVRADYHWW